MPFEPARGRADSLGAAGSQGGSRAWGPAVQGAATRGCHHVTLKEARNPRHVAQLWWWRCFPATAERWQWEGP